MGISTFSQQTTNTGFASPVSSGNAVINGAFDIWQRGTTFTSSGYGPDRWNLDAASFSVTRQTSNPPLGSRFYSRITATAAFAYANHRQIIETQNTSYYWGKTVTLSAKIRRNATMNAGINLILQRNSAVDATQSAAGWTSIAVSTIANANITTGTGVNDWTDIVLTTFVPNDGTANTLRVLVGETAGIPNGSVWELANVQLEEGPVARPFRRNGNTIDGEVSACQRYYYTWQNSSATMGQTIGNAWYAHPQTHPTEMRVAPAATMLQGISTVYGNGSAIGGVSMYASPATANNTRVFVIGATLGSSPSLYSVWCSFDSHTVAFSAEL
jgi:hypothetical protein